MKRDAGEEMVKDAVESRGAVVDQILKINLHYRELLKPSKVGSKAFSDVGKFHPSTALRAGIGVGASEDANLEARVEIWKRGVVIVMDMPRFHVGHIKNM